MQRRDCFPQDSLWQLKRELFSLFAVFSIFWLSIGTPIVCQHGMVSLLELNLHQTPGMHEMHSVDSVTTGTANEDVCDLQAQTAPIHETFLINSLLVNLPTGISGFRLLFSYYRVVDTSLLFLPQLAVPPPEQPPRSKSSSF